MVKQKILLFGNGSNGDHLIGKVLSQSYNVLFATDGKDILKKARKAYPDLILLDSLMPVLDGFEVCYRLKINPKTVEIPIIFLSSCDTRHDKGRAFQLGALDYICKPIVPDNIKKTVDSYTKSKQPSLALNRSYR